MKYTIYNKATGVIVANLDVATEDDVIANVTEDDYYVNGDYDAERYFIKSEGVFEYPSKPGYWAEWNGTAWFDPRSSEQLIMEVEGQRNRTIAKINEWFDGYRRKYITPVLGQSTVYQMKESEARRYVIDPSPTVSDYPLIMAEIGITADTAENVAEVYLQLSDILIAALSKSEAVRLRYVALAEQAVTANEIDGVFDEFNNAVTAL